VHFFGKSQGVKIPVFILFWLFAAIMFLSMARIIASPDTLDGLWILLYIWMFLFMLGAVPVVALLGFIGTKLTKAMK
jgi:multisubunit Na+/H+ antiporter MnhF subunit